MAVLSRFGPPLALMGLIFYLSAQPGLASGLSFDFFLRKAAHMAEYGLLFLLWWRALGARAGAGWAAAAIAVAYAISDELHQSYVPDRAGKPLDVVIDAAGVALAALAARRWPRLRPGSERGRARA